MTINDLHEENIAVKQKVEKEEVERIDSKLRRELSNLQNLCLAAVQKPAAAESSRALVQEKKYDLESTKSVRVNLADGTITYKGRNKLVA
jgi:hypothetical protein